MLIRCLACAVLCLSGLAPAAEPAQEVADAAAKLSEAENYSWRSVTNDSSGSTLIQNGKTEKNGYTSFNLNSGDAFVQFVIKNGVGVVNIGQGWQTADELADQRKAARFLAFTARSFKSPAVVASQIAARLKDLKPEEDAYVAEVTGNDAVNLLSAISPLRGGRDMNNAKAIVRFWIRDGILTKYQVHGTGTINRKGEDTDFDGTTTVDFSDVGTTQMDVPEEAKRKLG
jgi:hypothetical protein